MVRNVSCSHESVTLEAEKNVLILNGQPLLGLKLQQNDIRQLREDFKQALQGEFPPISTEAAKASANTSASALRKISNRAAKKTADQITSKTDIIKGHYRRNSH